MNILVTGANGFIGSNIVQFLETNAKHVVIKGTRESVNLYSYADVSKFIRDNHIDSIIHCAIEGGRRNVVDNEKIVYNNILMAQNLLACKVRGPFINLASGAEFDRSQHIFQIQEYEIYNRIPRDYYGISKNTIAKLVNLIPNGINLRLFGCFNYNEADDRMIRSSLTHSLNKHPIIIHQDKYMDFVYIKDLCKLINVILSNPVILYKDQDINVVYKKKYKLSDIADLINNIDKHKVPVIIEDQTLGMNYCGDGSLFSYIPLDSIGLITGLNECYYKLL